MPLKSSTVVLQLILVTSVGCTGTYTRSGDIGVSFTPDTNGASTGFTLWNPFRDFVDDRNIPGGRMVPGDCTLDTPIVYKRPSLREGSVIAWDSSLGCYVARSSGPMYLEPGTALAIVEDPSGP